MTERKNLISEMNKLQISLNSFNTEELANSNVEIIQETEAKIKEIKEQLNSMEKEKPNMTVITGGRKDSGVEAIEPAKVIAQARKEVAETLNTVVMERFNGLSSIITASIVAEKLSVLFPNRDKAQAKTMFEIFKDFSTFQKKGWEVKESVVGLLHQEKSYIFVPPAE